MIGILTWLACGVLAGMFMSRLISGGEKGLLLLTITVGIGGAILGGFVASVMGFGNSATFSFYALLFAACGASLSLVGYRRLIGA